MNLSKVGQQKKTCCTCLLLFFFIRFVLNRFKNIFKNFMFFIILLVCKAHVTFWPNMVIDIFNATRALS